MEGGTAFNEDLHAIIIVGKVIRESTVPPTKGVPLGIPKKFRSIASPSSPNIIDGTAARLFIFTSIHSVHRFFGANSSS